MSETTRPLGLTRVRRNALFKILGESSRVFNLLLFILIARSLGDALFGSFSVAIALAIFFGGVADGGLNQLLIRDIAQDPLKAGDRKDLILGAKLLLAPAIVVAIAVFMIIARYPPDMIRLGLNCSAVAVTKSWLDYSFALFSGHERMQYEASLKAFNQALTLVVGGWILGAQGGINAVVLSMAGANVLTLTAAFFILRRIDLGPSKPRFQAASLIALFKEARPLAISVLFSAFFIRIDLIMLSLFRRSPEELGAFAAGTKFIEAAGTLPMLLTAAIFPVLADHAKNNRVQFGEMLRKWRLRLLAIAAVVTAVLILARGPLIHLTFGPDFTATVRLLAILALSLPAIFLNYGYLGSLIVLGEQRAVAQSTLIALCVNLAANLVLIPLWGATGAAIALVAGQNVMCILAHLRLQQVEDRIQTERIAEIKKELMKFYNSSDAYYSHLDHHIDVQLEHFKFGKASFADLMTQARSVLEIGSGSGILLSRLKEQYPDKAMTGVDLSPIGVEMARKRAAEKQMKIEFHVADVEKDIPLPPNSFDLVICNEVLEHLTHPEAAVRTMCQMVAPGGHLVLVFPNRCTRASLLTKLEKAWDTVRMILDQDYIHPRFETPPFDKIGEDADATYIAHPWEVQRMVKRAGLRFRYKSLVRGRLVAQK